MKAIVITPTPDRNKSLYFYSALKYRILNECDPCLVTDGKVIIEIDEDRFARAGIALYHEDWSNTIAELKNDFKVMKMDKKYIVCDPNGVVVSLMSMSEYPKFKKPVEFKAATGNFNGISIEAFEFDKSLNFWQILGYKVTMGSPDGGWVAMTNGTDVGIGMMKFNMCPHLFFNPSFTYFNGKENLNVIEEIRKANVPITEEITHFNKDGIVDNLIIRDPGGFGFFLFSD